MVVEGLTGFVRTAISLNRLQGLAIGANQVEVSFLQFAYDTLMVCQASHKDIMVVKTILRCSELASGLKVNFHKSGIGVVGVESQQLLVFTDVLNCTQMFVPFKYLGLQVGGNPRKREFWKEFLDKVKKKLSKWKGKNLTFVDRVCLIKSVFTVVPLYCPFSKPQRWYAKS